MPSVVLGYVPGSGFTPLFSGNPWSGYPNPVGGIQIKAWKSNSGSIYVALSGGNAYSGQAGTLVGSGGPTINSGGTYLSGGGLMDGVELTPGDAYFIPHLAIFNKSWNSGIYNLCVGCDPAVSGQGRVYWEGL